MQRMQHATNTPPATTTSSNYYLLVTTHQLSAAYFTCFLWLPCYALATRSLRTAVCHASDNCQHDTALRLMILGNSIPALLITRIVASCVTFKAAQRCFSVFLLLLLLFQHNHATYQQIAELAHCNVNQNMKFQLNYLCAHMHTHTNRHTSKIFSFLS